jgi:hypothetical protein
MAEVAILLNSFNMKWKSLLQLWPFVLIAVSIIGLAYVFLARR